MEFPLWCPRQNGNRVCGHTINNLRSYRRHLVMQHGLGLHIRHAGGVATEYFVQLSEAECRRRREAISLRRGGLSEQRRHLAERTCCRRCGTRMCRHFRMRIAIVSEAHRSTCLTRSFKLKNSRSFRSWPMSYSRPVLLQWCDTMHRCKWDRRHATRRQRPATCRCRCLLRFRYRRRRI